MTEAVRKRLALERRIIGRIVNRILADPAGYRIGVSLERGYDTDEMLLGSRSRRKILDAAMAGDECHLFVQPATGSLVTSKLRDGSVSVISRGWIFFVLGEGEDVVSDYTMNLEEFVNPEMVPA